MELIAHKCNSIGLVFQVTVYRSNLALTVEPGYYSRRALFKKSFKSRLRSVIASLMNPAPASIVAVTLLRAKAR